MRGGSRPNYDDDSNDSYDDPLSRRKESRPKDNQMKQPKPRSRLPTDPNQVFAFQRLTYQVATSSGPVQVLHGVSACVPVRSLSAVLGPSGAGKSSLFDVLLGEAEMEYVDGNAPLQDKVAYVTQDSQLVVSETVLDVMWFYANLALPRHTPMAHRRQLIEDILFAMDMSHTQDTYVGGVEVAYAVVIEGGLSSGERRRLQVCATLISKPEVVILDEPTTGLDATNALHLVRVLKRLCRDTSMTAIASLHQCRREIMTELDGALLLCKGRMVYSGPMDEVLAFIQKRFQPLEQNENPMDYILEFLSSLNEEQADKLNAANNQKVTSFGTTEVRAKLRHIREEGTTAARDAPGIGERIRVLTGRYARIYWYKWSIYNVFGPLFLILVVGLFVACMCLNIKKDDWQDAQNFINMLALTTFSLARNGLHTSAVCGFARASLYMERGKSLYKGLDSYIALQVFEIPMGAFFSIVCYLVMWLPVGWGYDAPDRLAKSILLFMIAAQAFRAMFTAVQLSSKTSPSARIIATFTVVDATGGIFLKYLDIPVYARWLCYTNPFFFVMAGLTQIEFTNYEYPGIQQHIVHNYGFDEFSLWQCYYYLGAQYIVYALLGFYLFAIVDMSGKRVVELGYGEAPLVKVAAKLNPFAGKKDKKDDKDENGLISRKGYGSNTVMPMALANNKLPSVLQYINITYEVINSENEVKTILHGVSFNIKRSTMFAIMGPSGAGKTSLLKIIGGFHQGGVMNATYLAGITPDDLGYVTADDMLPVLDTVEEVLTFYAEFGLPLSMSKGEKDERVQNVMDLMALNHISRTFVGGQLGAGISVRGVSGGEKRRVSIGCALLKNPAVVVLDEPTSGLDSSKASEVMEACEQLTRLGRTVICTIHQPRIDIFNMFHYVMYVAAGEVVYVGPPHLTAPAFEQATGGKCNANENLADFVIDCLVGLNHDEIVDLQSRLPRNHGPTVPLEEDLHPIRINSPPPEQLSAGRRMTLISRRLLREIWRDQEQMVERFKFMIITTIIFALPSCDLDKHHLLTSQVTNRKGVSMLLLKFITVQASNTIPVIQQGRALSMHEMKLGFYRPFEFYASQVLIYTTLFSTTTSAVGFHLTYAMAGYTTGYMAWFVGWANFFMMSCLSEIMAVILAVNLPSYPAAAGAYTGFFVCCLIPLCGLFIATPDLPYIMRGIAYYNPMYYTSASDIINEFQGRELIKDDSLGFYTDYTNGDQVIREFGFDRITGSQYYNLIIITVQTVLLCFVGYRSLYQLLRQTMMTTADT